jgi:hypothetical protein
LDFEGRRPKSLPIAAVTSISASYRDEGRANWAIIASLIETRKLNGRAPKAWVTDLISGPHAAIDKLMPRANAPAVSAAINV